jgi:hypothetical protein
MKLPKGVSERGQGMGVGDGTPGCGVAVGMTGGAVGVPLVSAVVLAVAEPDATGVFVPDDDEGPIAQATLTAHKAMSATRMPAREERDRMGVSF